MARPKVETDKTRPHVVAFRLNHAEYARLQSEAAPAGLSVNERAREKATGELSPAHPQGPQIAASPEAFQLTQQLIRVGVNLNQIARRLNMTGEHQPDELRDACSHCDEILQRIIATDLSDLE